MDRVQLLIRFSHSKKILGSTFLQTLRLSSSSSSSSSSDDEKKRKHFKSEEKKKSNEALEKLNKLLLTMTDDKVSPKKINLAQPTNKRIKQKEKPKSPISKEEQMVKVTKKVAESIGGDVKQTQSELLEKLLNATHGKGSGANLNDLVKGMKIDHEKPIESKAQQVRSVLKSKTEDGTLPISKFRPKTQPRTEMSTEKINLFGSEPLGIFTDVSDSTEGVENKVWKKLYEKDLKMAITHPPSNYFQQMILWTEQGKVWKFPIDNEQGLDEEKKIYFTEHVFLEKHLEPWCPPKGPIRHFMELVCVGLSKNPYITVDDKREHIMWFKKYFEDKKQLLAETGALGDHQMGGPESSQKVLE